MIICLIYVKVGGFRELLVWIGWGIFFVCGETWLGGGDRGFV